MKFEEGCGTVFIKGYGKHLYAFLRSDIQHSTFHHQPKAGDPRDRRWSNDKGLSLPDTSPLFQKFMEFPYNWYPDPY